VGSDHVAGQTPSGIMQGALPGYYWSSNCRPIMEAGQALLVDDAFQLDDNFTLIPTPGHSACHYCVMIRSQGHQAIVTGDMMHHALQCREPDWSTIFDFDPVQAAQSRRRLLGLVADTGTFVLPVHFPQPGLVSADGYRFRYAFVRYRRPSPPGEGGERSQPNE
jgi:glyoxylase-like metal-dependent hydrolase (beta-lactamase superfamily II)